MINASDFRNGVTIEMDNGIWTVVSFLHVKPGKGAAFVRTKLKNIVTGAVIERTFNPTDKMAKAHIETKEMQYLYNDGADYIFMDNETYEQVSVPADFVGDNSKWLRENDTCQLLYAEEELMGVNPPMFIIAEVTETVPGAKGDTVQGAYKPATIDTGAVVQVPMYLNEGESIKIDTRTGEFVSRA